MSELCRYQCCWRWQSDRGRDRAQISITETQLTSVVGTPTVYNPQIIQAAAVLGADCHLENTRVDGDRNRLQLIRERVYP
jgi:hypothetical protein